MQKNQDIEHVDLSTGTNEKIEEPAPPKEPPIEKVDFAV